MILCPKKTGLVRGMGQAQQPRPMRVYSSPFLATKYLSPRFFGAEERCSKNNNKEKNICLDFS